jgi:hypothetical protein
MSPREHPKDRALLERIDAALADYERWLVTRVSAR